MNAPIRMSAKEFREGGAKAGKRKTQVRVEPRGRAVASVTVTLTDMPPSANQMRKHFIRYGKVVSVKSDAYAAWKSAAVQEIVSARHGHIEGPYRLAIAVQRDWKSKRARDIDNILKPCSDALVAAGVVSDDSLAESVSAKWADDLGGPAVVIEIEVVE